MGVERERKRVSAGTQRAAVETRTEEEVPEQDQDGGRYQAGREAAGQ